MATAEIVFSRVDDDPLRERCPDVGENGSARERLQTDLDDVRRQLADDVDARLGNAAAAMLALLDGGLPFERLACVVHRSQTWQARSMDARSRRLEREREELADRLVQETDPARSRALEAALEAASQRCIDRRDEIRRDFEPAASVDTMIRLRGPAADLRRTPRMSLLLDRYQRIDAELSAFEFALGQASRMCASDRSPVLS